MADNLMLTPDESEVIEGFVAAGPVAINKYNIDELTFALLKAAPQTFNKAMSILSSEAKLRKEIVDQIGKSTEIAVSSSSANTQKIIENAKANSELLRNLLSKDDIPFEKFKMCFDELRRLAQSMEETNIEAQNFQRELINQQNNTIQDTAKNSTVKDIAIGVGGLALGAFFGFLIKTIFGGNNDSNNPNPPVDGTIT